MKTTTNKTLTIAGKTGKLNADQYVFFFKTKDAVIDFLTNVKTICHTTNFGLSPFNKMAYGKFCRKGVTYTVNAPRQSNGDFGWLDYRDESRRFITIEVTE